MSKATIQEAKRICKGRGFTSLSQWAKENRRAAKFWHSPQSRQGLLRSKAECAEMARALDNEYRKYLEGNV